MSSKTNIITYIKYTVGGGFAMRICELRKEKGLNQVGLALKLNVSQKMISAYECGVHQPSIDTLIQMSKIFGASVDYIIGISDIRMPAEKFAAEGLTEDEVQLLDLYRQLDRDTQKKSIGIIFALSQYENN